MKILNLQLLKKKRSGQFCFQILLDDETEHILDADTVGNFKLRSELSFSPSHWQEICDFDALRVCSRKAINLVSIRYRSHYELQERLLRDGFKEATVEQTLARLEDNKYLNDEEFAVRFAKSKIQKKTIGENALRHELKKKGLSDSVIENAVTKTLGGRDELAAAWALGEKKNRSLREADPVKRLKKIAMFLAQRGFSADICYKAADRICKKK